MEIEWVATLEPLDHTPELLRANLRQCVDADRRSIFGLIGIATDEAAALGLNDELIGGDVELDLSLAAEWPLVRHRPVG